jgi:hypothetical protein
MANPDLPTEHQPVKAGETDKQEEGPSEQHHRPSASHEHPPIEFKTSFVRACEESRAN